MTPPDRVTSFGKPITTPVLMTDVANLVFGLQGIALGVLFFMNAPTATTSFTMVLEFGHNTPLSTQIIAMTTAISVVSIGAGTFILSDCALI